jgi:hypothetical protein
VIGLRRRLCPLTVPYNIHAQPVGIIPDIEVRLTIAGIREGRGELLEAALRLILGPDFPSEEIRQLRVAGSEECARWGNDWISLHRW